MGFSVDPVKNIETFSSSGEKFWGFYAVPVKTMGIPVVPVKIFEFYVVPIMFTGTTKNLNIYQRNYRKFQ